MAEGVEPQLEEIRWAAKASGLGEGAGRVDNGHQFRPGRACFDRLFTHHILPSGAQLAMPGLHSAGTFTMLARQQELNTQFHQLLDALLLALALFASHALRFYGTGWLDLPYSIDPFQNYQWLLIV